MTNERIPQVTIRHDARAKSLNGQAEDIAAAGFSAEELRGWIAYSESYNDRGAVALYRLALDLIEANAD